MIRRFLCAACAMGLTACHPGGSADGSKPSDQQTEPAQAMEQIDTLDGEWRVISIDGDAMSPASLLLFEADDEEIWWNPRCAGAIRSYALDGYTFSAGPRRDLKSQPPGTPPPPVCTIGHPPRLAEAMTALDAAITVGRDDVGNLHFEGGGHSLVLSADIGDEPGMSKRSGEAEPPPPPPPPVARPDPRAGEQG